MSELGLRNTARTVKCRKEKWARYMARVRNRTNIQDGPRKSCPGP